MREHQKLSTLLTIENGEFMTNFSRRTRKKFSSRVRFAAASSLFFGPAFLV